MYIVSFRSGAIKELRKLSAKDRKKIATAIDSLVDVPRPNGVKKMVGANAWRIRVGDYRLVYVIEDKQLVVEVIRIGHRRDVYR
jgi:mRNA interferase RelE/StbE